MKYNLVCYSYFQMVSNEMNLFTCHELSSREEINGSKRRFLKQAAQEVCSFIASNEIDNWT